MADRFTMDEALEACQLGILKEEFNKQRITPDLVAIMSTEDLHSLGVKTTGDRLRLKRHCDGAGASTSRHDSASAIMQRLATPTKHTAKKVKTQHGVSPFKRIVQVGMKVKRGGQWVQCKSSKTKKWKNFHCDYTRDSSGFTIEEDAIEFFFPDGKNTQMGDISEFSHFLADYMGKDVSALSLTDMQQGQRGAIRLYLHLEEKEKTEEDCESISSNPRDSDSDDADDQLPEIKSPLDKGNDVGDLQNKVEELLKEIVGLTNLKESLRRFARQSILDSMRRKAGLLSDTKRPVMVFSGNPGTGKTSVASIVAEIMHMTGQVKSARLVTVQRDNLVSNHVGETAIKTATVIESASGGTLLVDEAYRLTNQDRHDFGPEAVETLMAKMEGGHTTTSDRPAFIFAGYPEEMDEFIKLNPGFSRRVTHHFRFPDYGTTELTKIFLQMCRKQNFEVGEAKVKYGKL